MALSPRHEAFAKLVATGTSALAAYKAVGYNPKYADKNSYRLTENEGIKARIKELTELLTGSTLVTASKLHERWSEMFEADVSDIVDDNGKLLPIKQWPKVWRQMLTSMDVKELFERSKDGGDKAWDKIGEVIKLRWIEQSKLGELIGRHKSVDAFVSQKPLEVHNHLHVQSLSEALAAGRARARILDVQPEVKAIED